MTPETNVADHVGQINQYHSLTSIVSSDKLKIIRKPEVLALTCISKSTLHLRMSKGLLPPSISIGERAVAYIEHEFLAVIAAQIQGKSDDDIRSLVCGLVAQRQNLLGGVQQ